MNSHFLCHLKTPLLVFGIFGAGATLASEIQDVTSQWTFREEVISAFPETISIIPKEENARIIRVYQYSQGDAANPLNSRRIEVFYTGGDWMTYGLVYFIANSPNLAASITPDISAAYFMADLSTTDREDGETPPAVDPLDEPSLRSYIVTKFLDGAGSVLGQHHPIGSL